jgi:hypothetical protein
MNADSAKHIVAVHVGEGDMAAVKIIYPDGNWIGSIILRRVLELACLRDGIDLLMSVSGSGALNDCIILFVVDDRETTIQTIKAEMERVALSKICQIAVTDGDGWRCVYPSPEVKMEWLLDSERQELYSSQLDQAVEKLLRKPDGQGGDKP